MLMILSPAKTIDTNIKNIDLSNNSMDFENETKELVSILKQYSVDELSRLMKISDKLALLNYDRYRSFYEDNNKRYTAILAFKGEAYKGLDANSLSIEELEYANKTLRILSGLYGRVKPLDNIREYRLEMGTPLENNNGKDLYEFWGNKITDKILEDIDDSPGENILINLASKEYSRVLDLDSISRKYRVVDIKFLENKNGKHKVISVYAKKARGAMVNYMLTNRISLLEDIKEFDLDGYMYNELMSSDNEFVFTR